MQRIAGRSELGSLLRWAARRSARALAPVPHGKQYFSTVQVGAQEGYDIETVRSQLKVAHANNNVPDGIIERVGRRLLDEVDHPLRSIAQIV